MAVKTFDPGQVVISFGGVVLSGYADGTFIMVERSSDAFSKVVGAGGDVARVRNRDRSGRVTVTLMQTSLTNDRLSAIAAQDELAGTGVGPLLIKDLGGTTLISAQSCWIAKVPNQEFGKEFSNREWIFDTSDLEILVGGSL